MKLLLDHNLSHKLCAKLSDLYPESSHTRFLSFERAVDPVIWFHARTHGFMIVTKDKDIAEIAVLKVLRQGSSGFELAIAARLRLKLYSEPVSRRFWLSPKTASG